MAKKQRDCDCQQVLYIADTQDLLPYDSERNGQSSPLAWGKFRTPAPLASKLGGPARSRHEMYSMRRSAVKGRKDGFAFLGVYDEILIHYGFARRAALRGWLVNHLYRPATAAQIAGVTGCRDVGLVRRAITALTAEGLLVPVKLPNLAVCDLMDVTTYPQVHDGKEAEADDPDDDRTDDRPGGREEAAQGEAGASGAKVEPVGNRNATGKQPGDVRRETGDGRRPDGQTPTTASAAPSPCSADGCGNTAANKETASAAPSPADGPRGRPETPDGARSDDQAADGSDGGQAATDATAGRQPPNDGRQPATPPPPAEAEPLEPTEADPGQAAKARPPPLDRPAMDWHAERMAEQVRDVLYPDREALVDQGRRCTPPQGADEFRQRETACLASCFGRALPLVDQVGAMRLLQRSLQEAHATFRKKAKKTRGRLWVYWFNQHVAAMRRDRAEASGPP